MKVGHMANRPVRVVAAGDDLTRAWTSSPAAQQKSNCSCKLIIKAQSHHRCQLIRLKKTSEEVKFN